MAATMQDSDDDDTDEDEELQPRVPTPSIINNDRTAQPGTPSTLGEGSLASESSSAALGRTNSSKRVYEYTTTLFAIRLGPTFP